MKIVPRERWILLGASRGLGQSFLRQIVSEPIEILAMARKMEPWKSQNVEIQKADFSIKENWSALFEQIQKFSPTRIFYFAGGGPFGRFEDKAWKDHEWAWKLNFEFPAYLLYQSLRTGEVRKFIKQLVFVGSSIAENSPDPLASSYASAKHALKGLVTTVQREQESSEIKSLDIRLFSPGYMDTSLLPLNAWPRQQEGLLKSPEEVSRLLLDWIQNLDDANGHFCLPSQIKLK